MQEYIRAILALGAVSLVCALLFPGGAQKNKSAFELALAIIALSILARPLATVREFSFSFEMPDMGGIGEIIEGAEGETMAAVAEAVGEGIAADITDRFSLPKESVRAEVTLSVADGEMTVDALVISLGRGAIHADHIAIRDYARRTYTQNCEVKTDGG